MVSTRHNTKNEWISEDQMALLQTLQKQMKRNAREVEKIVKRMKMQVCLLKEENEELRQKLNGFAREQ